MDRKPCTDEHRSAVFKDQAGGPTAVAARDGPVDAIHAPRVELQDDLFDVFGKSVHIREFSCAQDSIFQ
jgi:hypothetical protein